MNRDDAPKKNKCCKCGAECVGLMCSACAAKENEDDNKKDDEEKK